MKDLARNFMTLTSVPPELEFDNTFKHYSKNITPSNIYNILFKDIPDPQKGQHFLIDDSKSDIEMDCTFFI